MNEPLVITESLGGSKLSKAGRAGELPEWFVPVPRSVSEWEAHARHVIESVSPRWLEELEPAIQPHGAAAARLRRSAGGLGLVVTTGQQPGLFGGPLMTFVKALSARALADSLQALLGIPVAPVFWAATDDADFDEAATVSVPLDGGARELSIQQRSPSGTPVTHVPLGDDVAALSEMLRAACGSAPHASYLEKALRLYHEGTTVGDAYVALLREVLEPLEISVFDVSHPCVSHASAPILLRAAAGADAIADAVKRRNEEIVKGGFALQVEEVPGLAHVFLNEHGTKRRLSLREASTLESTDGQSLSSTVLVRPVLERALFPTAAYMAGPGEFAYFAQVTAVAEAIDLPRPLVLPRWSTTILEPRVQRILNDLDVTAGALADPHAVEGQLARARLSQPASTALADLRTTVRTSAERLAEMNDGAVSTHVIDGLRKSITHRLDRLERRFVAGVKQRETELMRRIGTARGSLYPHGSRQERQLAFIPFLARYGMPLVEQMLAAARIHADRTVGASDANPVRETASVR